MQACLPLGSFTIAMAGVYEVQIEVAQGKLSLEGIDLVPRQVGARGT